ncbi:endo-1,4-beta-xylanase [Hymenobacter sp. BT507]|uniref:endo-1,4-beta-xylanase n=1 Tax=Hymenobacter citatus TaxID=2763506 RepID=A0ABR7MGE0_9BACT|nr:endo-1,4-beta-xylanase [Hymenobacter citatus]MBC6610008.1 endo-1,4-beta-xylanase [Hymenobacter citatus]
MRILSTLLMGCLLAWAGAAQAQNAPVRLEAESGTLGADWTSPTQAGVQYVTITPTATINAQNPGTAARVVSYSVTFPGPGSYDLYARVRVGAAAANDDSFYYANGFGTKAPTDDTSWIICNNLNVAGYTDGGVAVDGAGAATNNVWKWINLSKFNGGEAPVSFTVDANNLTQTFQIGAREDGFDIDKFVFGATGLYFTVPDLDAGAQGSTTPPVVFTPTGQPIAQGKSKFLGGVYSTPQLPFFTVYWNQVVPENAGKWGSVEATRDQMNWTELDAAYKLAKDNNFPFRFHVLLWGSQQPVWIENLPAAEQLAEINQWMAAVAQRYPDLDLVEVVNEPTNDPPLNGYTGNNGTNTPGGGGGNYYEALGGAGSTGWDWIIKGFELARQHFPKARLMLNDYGVASSTANAQRYLSIINLLKERNLIDAVGIQGHAFETRNITAANLGANLDIIASAGKPLYVTEMDIDGVNAAGQLDDAAQLAEYQRIFPVFWTHPAVRGVTLWGYRPGHWRTNQGAYLAKADNTERAALTWLRSYVANTVLSRRQALASSVQLYPNPTVDGHFLLNRTDKVTALRVFDTQGRLVHQQTPHRRSTLEVRLALAPGLYVVQLEEAGHLTTRSLIVN